jgi:hypothetical protein
VRRAIFASCCVLVTSALAAKADEPPKCPPTTYSLEGVDIRLSKSVRGGRGSSLFEFRGTGHGRVVQRLDFDRSEEFSFTVTSLELIDLVNRFLNIYFFDLADSYGHPLIASLKADGSVETQGIIDSHAPVTTVTLTVGQCTKRSQFEYAGPPELRALARELEDFAMKRRKGP